MLVIINYDKTGKFDKNDKNDTLPATKFDKNDKTGKIAKTAKFGRFDKIDTTKKRALAPSASVNRKILEVTRKHSATVKQKFLHLAKFSKSFIISL